MSLIELSPLLEKDLPQLCQWFADPIAAGQYDGVLQLSLKEAQKKFKAGGFANLRIVSYDGKYVGWADMNPYEEAPQSAMMAVQISLPEYRGRGLGKRIHEMMIVDFCRNYPAVRFIEVWTHVGNVAENRILESLGFRRVGNEPKEFDINGSVEPFLSYELKV